MYKIVIFVLIYHRHNPIRLVIIMTCNIIIIILLPTQVAFMANTKFIIMIYTFMTFFWKYMYNQKGYDDNL
jgi:hypothetical protein